MSGLATEYDCCLTKLLGATLVSCALAPACIVDLLQLSRLIFVRNDTFGLSVLLLDSMLVSPFWNWPLSSVWLGSLDSISEESLANHIGERNARENLQEL